MTAQQLYTIARDLIGSTAVSAGIALVSAIPIFLVGWNLHRRRKKFRTQSVEPFTEMPLRPPGESLRKRIEELGDAFDTELGATMVLCIGATVLVTTLVFTKSANWIVIAFVGFVQVFAAFMMWRNLRKLQTQLWSYRLGFDGERIVGEHLNRLMADGFEVFHDVPFDGFNIDHVIVGPPGVFAIETKTRRKPAGLKGTAKATVIYDGAALHFPNKTPDTDALEQALRNAKTVAKFLTSATGELTEVKPILTLPGWWVERKGRGPVNVLNPKEVRNSFVAKAEPLSSERIKRIAHQLTERCRIEKVD